MISVGLVTAAELYGISVVFKSWKSLDDVMKVSLLSTNTNDVHKIHAEPSCFVDLTQKKKWYKLLEIIISRKHVNNSISNNITRRQ